MLPVLLRPTGTCSCHSTLCLLLLPWSPLICCSARQAPDAMICGAPESIQSMWCRPRSGVHWRMTCTSSTVTSCLPPASMSRPW